MSDEIGNDRPKRLEDTGDDGTPASEVDAGSGDGDLGSLDLDLLEESGLTTDTPVRDVQQLPIPDRPGARSRIGGALALLFGVVGSLLAVLTAAIAIRFGFNASDSVDRAMAPVEVAFDRMDTRIDETDDLVDREGIDPDRIDELQARVDGLVDVSTGADEVYNTIEDHLIYSLLPADLLSLGEALAGFEESASAIDRRLGGASGGDSLDPSVAVAVAEELDGMQRRVSGSREMISSASSSLRGWIRFAAFLGFLGSFWGLWGQVSLARRGWRGFRGRPI